MALNYKTDGLQVSMEAEEAMVEPYVFVEVGTTAGQVAFQDASTSVATPIVGVIQNSASAGDAVNVQMTGISKAVAGAAIAKGARVHVGSIDGRIDDDQDGTAGSVYVGIALEAASAAGEIISVAINCPAVGEDGGT